ncbi:hypothetical protein K469DRAFT_805227 [Zopfia rhizophila CBS 207.26]|uniref:Uncharacterized protein n=1 Tax=Zopfia rhizophila CBS 207.26 TaxID=1314779 RepID=A0A6A6EMF0_9PEZI|nr:hypothetical protein K469DRAFT_805227 [Zopfia rhizophila CBS 207.26]
MEAEWNWAYHNASRRHELEIVPERFKQKRDRWRMARSKRRWFSTYVLYTAAIIFGSVSIKKSLVGMPTDLRNCGLLVWYNQRQQSPQDQHISDGLCPSCQSSASHSVVPLSRL